MGWYYTRGASKADVVAELLEGFDRTGKDGKPDVYRTTAHAVVSNVLWTIHEHEHEGRTDKWIGCYLLSGGDAGAGGWGYKPMEESAGPFYYSVPLWFLDEVPEVNAAWRLKVRELRTAKRGAA